MKSAFSIRQRATAAIALVIFGASVTLPSASQARQGATDPIPGTSKGATNSGGGGGGKKSSTTVTLPSVPTTPVQPLVTATLTMTGSDYNGSTPQCTGSYHIDPYYPTLSLITIDLSASSVSTPDGSPLFVNVTTTGGTTYPYLGTSFNINGGSGSTSAMIYCTPGTVIASVDVVDLLGNIVFTGK